MAGIDALSDLTTFTQAFGQMTNSLVQLQEQRTRLEVDRATTYANKVRYDFLSRLNLPPGHPDRLTPEDRDGWSAAIKQVDTQVNSAIGYIKDPRIRESVNAKVGASQQNFMLSVEDELTKAYIKEVQALDDEILYGILNTAKPNGEKLAEVKAHFASSRARGIRKESETMAREKEILPKLEASLYYQGDGDIPGVSSLQADYNEKTSDGMSRWERQQNNLGSYNKDVAQEVASMIATERGEYNSYIGKRIEALKADAKDPSSSARLMYEAMDLYDKNYLDMDPSDREELKSMLVRWDNLQSGVAIDIIYKSYLSQYGRGQTYGDVQILKSKFESEVYAALGADGGRDSLSIKQWEDMKAMMGSMDSWKREGAGAGDTYSDKFVAELRYSYDRMVDPGSKDSYWSIYNYFAKKASDVYLRAVTLDTDQSWQDLKTVMGEVFSLKGKLDDIERFKETDMFGMTMDQMLNRAGTRIVREPGFGGDYQKSLNNVAKKFNNPADLSRKDFGMFQLVLEARAEFEDWIKMGTGTSANANKTETQKLDAFYDLLKDKVSLLDYADKDFTQRLFSSWTEQKAATAMDKFDAVKFDARDSSALGDFFEQKYNYSLETAVIPLINNGKIAGGVKENVRPLVIQSNPNDMMLTDSDGYIYDVRAISGGSNLTVFKSNKTFTKEEIGEIKSKPDTTGWINLGSRAQPNTEPIPMRLPQEWQGLGINNFPAPSGENSRAWGYQPIEYRKLKYMELGLQPVTETRTR